jgi:hypothetical protein
VNIDNINAMIIRSSLLTPVVLVRTAVKKIVIYVLEFDIFNLYSLGF